ncbi:hypothetical protein BASA81_004044 [Batrachochytrium salamandrivorans]|nr:hypothetical protein BASA81_004044 [Batrachochytrium salamandrivorans]
MTSPLHSVYDIALQPRMSTMFRLRKISKLRDFHLSQLDSYSAKLGQHLIKDFRVTKPVSKDFTVGVVRVLTNDVDGEEEEDEDLFGDRQVHQCLVFEARVAPDHAKTDGQLGPRTSMGDVVLCLGQEEEEEGEWTFALCLVRGTSTIINSVLGFIQTSFAAEAKVCALAPHHLATLAHKWSAVDAAEGAEEEIRLLKRARKLRKRNFLEIEFTLPGGGGEGSVNTVCVTIEEESLSRLHAAMVEEDDDALKIMDVLTRHLAEHLKMDLMGAVVTQIKTPMAELTSSGDARFHWPAHLKHTMAYLAKAIV